MNNGGANAVSREEFDLMSQEERRAALDKMKMRIPGYSDAYQNTFGQQNQPIEPGPEQEFDPFIAPPTEAEIEAEVIMETLNTNVREIIAQGPIDQSKLPPPPAPPAPLSEQGGSMMRHGHAGSM